jgi:UDP-N-acetylmuramate dehydrogenase
MASRLSTLVISEDVLLRNYTTIRLGGRVRFFVEVKNDDDVAAAVKFAKSRNLPVVVLGGGSNIIFSDTTCDFVVLKMENKGISILEKDEESVLVESSAGEIWDNFVKFSVSKGFSGIEALSGIPGTCGAAPVQNIGAYGREVSQIIESVRVYDAQTGRVKKFSNADCKFSYRNSFFKSASRGRYVILSVLFRLGKTDPMILDYPNILTPLEKIKQENPDDPIGLMIRKTILRMRSEKLPDPAVIPNSGSFFENVFVSEKKVLKLKEKFGDLPVFSSGQSYKIPAGWLIERAGWKGYFKNGVGVYDKNALVLINRSGSTRELLKLAREIQKSVKNMFDLNIDIEPDIFT